MSTPRTSGLLEAGGLKRFRRRRNVIRQGFLTHMPDVHLSDGWRIKREVWDFDPLWEFEYSDRELLLMTEKILLLDPKPGNEEPVWLNASQLLERSKREIYVGNGIPDPAITSGLYWRTHPQGRKVQSDHNRKHSRASFYR